MSITSTLVEEKRTREQDRLKAAETVLRSHALDATGSVRTMMGSGTRDFEDLHRRVEQYAAYTTGADALAEKAKG